MTVKAPEKKAIRDLSDYLDALTRSVFETGLSWQTIGNKWPGIRDAFHGFDPEFVANLNEDDKAQLLQDKRIIRNRRKVDAIVVNSRRMIEIDKEFGGFRKYLRSHGSFEELVQDLRKQFRFIGEMGAYHFLWTVGERVPPWEHWEEKHQSQ